MIDLQQELKNFSPIDLDSLVEENANLPDNVKDSVALYNSALENLRTGSEDIAVIELKKAVAINPDFYEAMNLLGLCYSFMKENEKASEMFERVIKAEPNSIRALKYLNALNQKDLDASTAKEKRRAAQKAKKVKPVAKPSILPSGTDLPSRTEEKKKNPRFEIVKMVTAFVAGVIVTAIIAMPFFRSMSGELSELRQKEKERENIVPVETPNPYKEKYENLNKDYEKLQEQFALANKEIDYYKNVALLYSIDGLASSKKYEEAADLLVELKQVQFREPEKEKFDRLYEQVIPQALSIAYNEGNRLFNNGRYQEAVDKLSKIPVYTDDWRNMDAALYLLGKSYAALNDRENARASFQAVIERYPDSQYATWSKGRMRELEQSQ